MFKYNEGSGYAIEGDGYAIDGYAIDGYGLGIDLNPIFI